MELDPLELETKSENLMTVVVESRKVYGKLCIDYDKKILLMENKLLNLQEETVSNYRFKPRVTVPNIEEGNLKDLDELVVEITTNHRRVEDMLRKLKNTQEVVMQLKADVNGKKLRAPLTADTMLARAKAKNV